ncbi:MAG: methyltransferase domain-containing protein [Desulfuromonadales bacterium]
MMRLLRIKNKIKKSGFRGVFASAMRLAASHIADKSPEDFSHQLSAHKVLSRYIVFEGKDILEIGGSQSCESAYPFLKDGAASITVTGLIHISKEEENREQNLHVLSVDALSLSTVFEPCSFDVVYGLSVVEHIATPKAFLEEVYKVLRPGGIAYFEGNPLWSSSKGHHLWVATWEGEDELYKNKATANYLFTELPNIKSTNPLPDWSHLLMTQEQMRAYLTAQSLPSSDIECIIDWVYHCDLVLNRLNLSEIAEAYTTSKLTVLEANTLRSEVPHDIELALRKNCGDCIDYGIFGISYVLARPLFFGGTTA